MARIMEIQGFFLELRQYFVSGRSTMGSELCGYLPFLKVGPKINVSQRGQWGSFICELVGR